MWRNVLFCALIMLCMSICEVNSWINVFKARPTVREQMPSKKTPGQPVLSVVDPRTGTNIHLIGVSHGSEPSAALVKSVMEEKKPAAVVVELCDDRFMTISLDAAIEPRGNRTRLIEYRRKRQALIERGVLTPTPGSNREEGIFDKKANNIAYGSRVLSTLSFAVKQGPVGGSFVVLGLLVGTLQRFSKTATDGDEFVTSMRVAEQQNIPVLLGDAPQNDTIRSVRQIATWDTLNPSKVVRGFNSLLFTAFGLPLGADTSTEDTNSFARVESDVMRDSQWISIPGVYIENVAMVRSLLPILLISLLPALADAAAGGSALADIFYSPFGGLESVDAALGVTKAVSADVVISSTPPSFLSSLLGTNIPHLSESVSGAITSVTDVLSILILIRMAKVIGADRDVFIAREVQAAALKYPDQELVVVVGMLHCNGVARHIMSGVCV